MCFPDSSSHPAPLCCTLRGDAGERITHQPLCPLAVLLQRGRAGLQGGLWVAERDSTQGSWSSKLHLHLNSSAPPYTGYSTFQTNFQEKAHKRVCHKLAFFCSPGKSVHHILASCSQRLYKSRASLFSATCELHSFLHHFSLSKQKC